MFLIDIMLPHGAVKRFCRWKERERGEGQKSSLLHGLITLSCLQVTRCILIIIQVPHARLGKFKLKLGRL